VKAEDLSRLALPGGDGNDLRARAEGRARSARGAERAQVYAIANAIKASVEGVTKLAKLTAPRFDPLETAKLGHPSQIPEDKSPAEHQLEKVTGK
jgi:hypothetical protein